jgi:glycosyltransferase involved in cell wall biosynthesis
MKISIVVPIYNSVEYLHRCVDSLINQTYKDLEIILINDGSTDESLDICKEYKKTDDRIKIIDKENGGLSDTRNCGIDNATGEYILFVDSDDYIEIETCSEFAKCLEYLNLDIITGDAKRIEGKSITFMKHGSLIKEEIMTGEKLLKHELKSGSMNMAAWLNLYNTEYLRKNKIYYKKGIYHEDELFTPQALLKAKKVMSLDNLFYNYIIRENSITTKPNQTKNAEDILSTCKTLEEVYIKISDSELKALLNDHLVNLYLNIFQVARLYKRKYKYLVDKELLKGKGHTRINKIRIRLFCFSPKLYYFLNFIRKKMIN